MAKGEKRTTNVLVLSKAEAITMFPTQPEEKKKALRDTSRYADFADFTMMWGPSLKAISKALTVTISFGSTVLIQGTPSAQSLAWDHLTCSVDVGRRGDTRLIFFK